MFNLCFACRHFIIACLDIFPLNLGVLGFVVNSHGVDVGLLALRTRKTQISVVQGACTRGYRVSYHANCALDQTFQCFCFSCFRISLAASSTTILQLTFSSSLIQFLLVMLCLPFFRHLVKSHAREGC